MTTTALNGENFSLVERVLSVTRERILSGIYPPGSRLRLQMLAEESGASLIPVREALSVLEESDSSSRSRTEAPGWHPSR